MKKEKIDVSNSCFGKKFLFVDKITGEVTWRDVSTGIEENEGLIRYIREDVYNENLHNMENQLAQSQNEIDRLNMRIYTRC